MAMTRSEISRKYNDAHCYRVQLSLNINTDAKIIDKLKNLENESKMGYIKRLIKEDIEKNG